MSAEVTSLIAGLKDAKTFGQGTFLDPGLYGLEITTCLLKPLRTGGHAFIMETKVLESSNPKHPVGSKASWFQGFKEREVAFGSIKLAFYAVLGLDAVKDKEKIEKDVDPVIETMFAKVVTENIFAGKKVSCQVSMKKTKKGLDFSLHTFSPYATPTTAA